MNDWRIQHGKVIADFMTYLSEQSLNFVLKGGTALYLCYKLDRFSEDIDLDGRAKELVGLVSDFCERNGYSFRVAKDTDTVQRCFINYGNEGRPLKIEASYRLREIHEEDIDRINGILVYKIEPLCVMKAGAYSQRDRIRDLNDLTFIWKNYREQLSRQTIALLRTNFTHKGIDQFDYLIHNQQDELIDKKKLADEFLELLDGLGLLYSEEERNLLEEVENDDEYEPDYD